MLKIQTLIILLVLVDLSISATNTASTHTNKGPDVIENGDCMCPITFNGLVQPFGLCGKELMTVSSNQNCIKEGRYMCKNGKQVADLKEECGRYPTKKYCSPYPKEEIVSNTDLVDRNIQMKTRRCATNVSPVYILNAY